MRRCAPSPRTLAIIKPEGLATLGGFISSVYSAGLRISQMQTSECAAVADNPQFSEWYAPRAAPRGGRIGAVAPRIGADAGRGRARARSLGGESAGNVVGIEVVGANSVDSLLKLCAGSTAVYASPSSEAALKDVDGFFSSVPPCTAPPSAACTCCLIKPHAVQDANVGKIVSSIQSTGSGFSIASIGMYNLEREDAAEFFEVYRGVVPEYGSMVDELTSNSFIAMMIEGGEDVVEEFRSLCGPPDPELAVILRPTSLRAQFGVDKVRNAVHCTDLPEDGNLEASYFFKVLLS